MKVNERVHVKVRLKTMERHSLAFVTGRMLPLPLW